MPQKFLKEDFETEDPWRYMADLPLEHVPTMKRVMVLIYHKLNPREKIFPLPNLNWTYLTREERKRVMAMINESEDNDLLVEMLRWFSAQFMGEDQEIKEATQTLRKHVVQAVRQPKSYQVEYLKEQKKWNEFLSREEDEDIDMDGTGTVGGLSTTPHLPPSEFVTSVSQPQGSNHDTTRLPVSVRNTLNGTKPFVDTTFQPSYSYKSETWREEICFKDAASAEAHYNKGWGQTSFTETNKRKRGEIELPYAFTTADEDVSTESDPDDSEEEVNIFAVPVLPARKTRTGKEFSAYTTQPSSKTTTTAPKMTSTPKATSSPKAASTPKAMGPPRKKPATPKNMLEASRTITSSPKPIIKSPNGKSKATLVHRLKFVDEDDEIDDWEPDM